MCSVTDILKLRVCLQFNITRETLVEALEGTIAADPAFAPHFVPLALDKLSSDVRHARCPCLIPLTHAATWYQRSASICFIWTGNLICPTVTG